MYSIDERNQTIQKLLKHFSQCEGIEAVVLVGSNARHEADQYSDIDMSIVAKEAYIKKLWLSTEKWLKKNFDFFKHFMQIYSENSLLIGMFLNNGLELDLGFTNRELFASHSINRPTLKQEILYATKDFEIDKKVITADTDVSTLIESRVNDMWYNFKNAIFALKRNNLFRAIKEIDEIREKCIQILAKERALESKHFRHVDKFEKNVKDNLKNTFFSKVSYKELKKSLLNNFNMFLDILNCHKREEDAKEYNKLFMQLIKDVKL